MSENKEIWMETTHGRRSKCKTEFKAVVNKVLISTLVITTLLGATATPAFAANVSNIPTIGFGNNAPYTQEYGISVETAISSLRNTISEIQSQKMNGQVSSTTLKTLANQLYSLESAVKYSSLGVTTEVKNIIERAEDVLIGVSGATEARVAVTVVKSTLGIDTITALNHNANAAESNLKSFSDVAKDRWSHDAIMEMVSLGMFAGTKTPDANGVGEFNPTGTMTKAQFITVITRYLYQDDLADMNEGMNWYENNYIMALSVGLVTANEIPSTDINKPITRQEMAMIAVRAAQIQGESIPELVPTTRIADYDSIGTYYRNYVRQAFSMGLLAGYDERGTFGATDTLTREQGAMVAYRLVNSSTRAEVDTSVQTPEDAHPEVAGSITIYAGQPLTQRNAKAGDVFVKKDGTKVVLKIGPNGVLGEGQGVAPDAYLDTKGGSFKAGNRYNFDVDVDGDLKDSAGWTLQNNKYWINKTTGEGHWTHEWNKIYEAYPKPTENGTYEGQLSTEGYSLYVWTVMGWVGNTTSKLSNYR